MKRLLVLAALLLAACGPSAQIATPSQNIVRQFKFLASFRPTWQWTVPGSKGILSLEREGTELIWTVREKPYADRRRTTFLSLLREPYYPQEGLQGLTEVRFSPSGKTILIHEHSPDGSRSQTIVFRQNEMLNNWQSQRIDLTEPAKMKLRKLDDGTRVPALVSNPIPPKILRLDDQLVIYEVDGKTRSATL